MKNLAWILFTLSLLTACDKTNETPNTTVTLKFYAVQICGQITDIAYSETPDVWDNRIKDLIEEEGIIFNTANLLFEDQGDQGFCGNCAKTGDVIVITAPANQEEALRTFGFMD